MMILMFSGGIAAMGNTMFPPESLQEGLTDDFSAQPIRLSACGSCIHFWLSESASFFG